MRWVDVERVVHTYRRDRLGQLLEERLGGTIVPAGETGAGQISGGVLVAQFTYDAAGSVTSQSVPAANWSDENAAALFTTKYEYDERNRLARIVAPAADGQHGAVETKLSYYETGVRRDLLKTRTDAAGHVTTYEYDERKQLTKVIESGAATGVVTRADGTPLTGSTTTEYQYDAAGNLWKTIDALGRETIYGFDAEGRVTNTWTPDPDGDGSLTRILSETQYLDHGKHVVELTPNPAGEGTVATRKWYDSLGRLVREQGPLVDGQAQFVGYQYQDDGSVLERRGVTTGMPLPEGFDNQYFADPLHAQNAGDTVTVAVLRAYDLAGRLTLEQTTYLDGGGGVRTETRTIARTFVNDLLVVTETINNRATTTKYDAYGRV